MIQPTSAGPLGQLLVEAEDEDAPAFPDETGYTYEHRPVYLYDEKGNLLQKFGGLDSLSVSLRPGRYMVVSDAKGKTRQVQVVIQDNHMTRVSLGDLSQATSLD